jgi:imidazolonepropionase-like amidohydrolase
MKKLLYFLLFSICYLVDVNAQETFPINGVKDAKPKLYALINAKVVSNSSTVIENATIVVSNGVIQNIGAGIAAPKAAIIIDCKGKTIYPSFIDIYTNYGMPESKRGRNENRGPQFLSNKKGAYHWNEAIKAEFDAKTSFVVNADKAESMREQGFGSVLSFQKDGIARGTSVFVNLNTDKENTLILKSDASSHYSFSKGSSTQDYPSSLMGSIALLRQTFYDADWYAKNNAETNFSYEAINKQKSLPKFFECSDVYDVFRAQKIASEFGTSFIYKTTGTDYQRLKELKAINASLVISLNFPKAYDVEDYYDAKYVAIDELKHWELAPMNAAFLEKEKIKFAITTSDLKSMSDFWPNLRKAIKHGLSEAQALDALTKVPAQMINASNLVGELKTGMKANFIIATGNLFTDEDAVILSNWVAGEEYVIEREKKIDLRGSYNLQVANQSYKLEASGSKDKPEWNIIAADSSKTKVSVSWNENLITLVFQPNDTTIKTKIRLSGTINNTNGIKITGEGSLNSNPVNWVATRTAPFKEETAEKKEEKKESPEVGSIIYPFAAYGSTSLPKAEKVLIKNATVWTNEKEGKLENTDVLIDGGKIVKIGKNLSDAGAKVIDGTGKHLTAGIIDEHSHIAISRGVNEGSQAVTSEVRIGDVLNPEDVNIYRQLAGGVTTSHLLHGSANPIGGQSALIKLRYGKNAEELKFEGADGFIKFALGENVKQSNWGDDQRERFPQTRMGVEQVFIDAFTRAREYEKDKTARKDLELDALVEILNKKRFITCHSYVQSEINMLMKVAEMFSFPVNTFTHILEGYKVADKMKTHGANASTFSDWWAYKYEVIDAIPYNAAIMVKEGLNVSINSDDAEMARRLNQEAAKTVKYGGLTEEEALKLVTLNPAKMLHIDNRVGSIKVGKDADLVLWNDHPLSIYAKPLKTFVDGIAYFDLEKDEAMRVEMRKEKERIIQKLLNEKKIGMPTQKPGKPEKKLYHCDDMEVESIY